MIMKRNSLVPLLGETNMHTGFLFGLPLFLILLTRDMSFFLSFFFLARNYDLTFRPGPLVHPLPAF